MCQLLNLAIKMVKPAVVIPITKVISTFKLNRIIDKRCEREIYDFVVV